MGLFSDALAKIGEGLADASSLDVVTYKGTLKSEGLAKKLENFDDVFKQIDTKADFKLLASTQCKIDGDISAFLDNDITSAELDRHIELVKAGQDTRKASIDFLKDIVGDVTGLQVPK